MVTKSYCAHQRIRIYPGKLGVVALQVDLISVVAEYDGRPLCTY